MKRLALNLLNESKPKLDLCDFGWEEMYGNLLPDEQLLSLPSYFTVHCGCKKIRK